MEWYQHSTNSHDDPDIDEAMNRFGHFGYAGFFMILEIYGQEYNHVENNGNLTITRSFLRKKLRSSQTKVEELLTFYSTFPQKKNQQPRFIVSYDNEFISITIPKYIEIASNWSKRKKNLPTEGTTETPHAIEKEEKRIEKKKNIKETTIKEDALLVLNYLNEKANRKFSKCDEIIVRLRDGGTIDDCKHIIDVKLHDPHFIENPHFMSPDTLFCKKHWDKYLNQTAEDFKPKPKEENNDFPPIQR